MLEVEAHLPQLHLYWIPKLDVSLCCRHCFGTGSTAEFRLFRYFDNHLTMILTQHEIYDTRLSTFLSQKNVMMYFSTIMILLSQHDCLLHKKLFCTNISATIALTATSTPTMLPPGLVFEKVHHFIMTISLHGGHHVGTKWRGKTLLVIQLSFNHFLSLCIFDS